MAVSEARHRLQNVKTAFSASAGKQIGEAIDSAIDMGGDFLKKVRESTEGGVEQARNRLSSAYEKADENLTPGIAAGGAAAAGGAGYLAGDEKEGSVRHRTRRTNRFLSRIEAESER
jgi:phage-related tail protein